MEDTHSGNMPLTAPVAGASSPLSTEGRIYTADGGVLYETSDQLKQREDAASAAALNSALFNNPDLARLMEDEALNQDAADTLFDANKTTAAWRIGRYVGQEKQISRHYLAKNGYSGLELEARSWFDAITGQVAVDPNYDKQAHAAELTKDIPVEYWDELLSYDNKASAFAARARIISDTQRERRIAAQRGTTSTLAMLAGGFADVDMPLTLASGGAIGGLRVAKAAYRAGRYAGLSGRASKIGASVVTNAWGGAQAGALVAGGLALVDDRADVDMALNTILGGATTGGALGVFATDVGRKVATDMRALHATTVMQRPIASIDTDIDKRLLEGSISLPVVPTPPDAPTVAPMQAGRGYGWEYGVGNYARVTKDEDIINDAEFADTLNDMKADFFDLDPDDIYFAGAVGWPTAGVDTMTSFDLFQLTRAMEGASWDMIDGAGGMVKWIGHLEKSYKRLEERGFGHVRDPIQDRATAQQDLNRLFLMDNSDLKVAREVLDRLGGDKTIGPLLGKQDEDGGAYWGGEQPNGMSGVITLGRTFQRPRAMVFMHELAHWAYMNVLPVSDRLQFWEAMRKYETVTTRRIMGMKFESRKIKYGDIREAVADKGNSSNSAHGPQEMFAQQFEMWATRQLKAEGNEIVTNAGQWKRVVGYMKEIMDRYIFGVPIDKELEPLFAKVMDSSTTQSAAPVNKDVAPEKPAISYKRRPESAFKGPQIPDMRTSPSPTTPYGKPLPEEAAFIHAITKQMQQSGAKKALADLANTVWGKIMLGNRTWITQTGVVGKAMAHATDALSRAANAVGNDVKQLYVSKANTANWFAMTILESPSSFGRGMVTATASALDAMMFRKIGSTMARWDHVANEWAKKNNATLRAAGKETGFHISREGARALYREVRLNMNDIRMGRAPRSGDNPEVMQLVQMIQQHGYESLKWLKGDNPQFSVKGTEFLEPDPGYIPQRANGDAMHDAIRSGRTTREAIEEAFTNGYVAAGLPQEIAEKIAAANVGRALARSDNVDTSLIDLLQEDGRSFLRERLELQGIPPGEVDQIMQHLTGLQAMAGQPGFTKHRNDLDMDIAVQTADGSDLRIVDFMDNDIPNMLARYRKGVSGAGALARKGIRSRKDRDIVFAAIRHEQETLGEIPIETDKLKAMLSDFDAGPSHGYYDGTTNKGVDSAVSVAKRVANLSLLANLGFSQVIDHANIIAADGLSAWWKHTKAGRRIDTELGRNNKELLEDLAVLQGEIGMDHIIYREHMDLDEISERDTAPLIKGMRRLTSNLTYIQGYTSMFNQIRGHQQRVAAAVLTNKVLRHIRNGDNPDRIKFDIGLSDRMVEYIRAKIADGTIEFRTIGGVEYVNRLNHDKWDAAFARDFGAAMVRGQDALVMRNLPGETDTWMRTNWGAVVTHLKMFPLTAIPKQLMRNGRFMDQQTMGSVMYGMAVAYLAMKVRDQLMGRELNERDQALRAISYSNMLGWLPMVVDPTMTMLGLDEYRMQRFGRHWETTLPIVETANKLWRVPGAAAAAIQGDMNGDDKAALLAIPFLKTLGIGEWVLGFGKRE